MAIAKSIAIAALTVGVKSETSPEAISFTAIATVGIGGALTSGSGDGHGGDAKGGGEEGGAGNG